MLSPHSELEALFSGLGDSAWASYRNSWLPWGKFCFVRGISIWLTPGEHGWDEPLLDFLIWTRKVMGRKSSTLMTRFAAIRFAHITNGNLDFTSQAHRVKAIIKGLKKREGAMSKHPFNTDLLRWMHLELVEKGGWGNGCSEFVYTEMFTACIAWFSTFYGYRNLNP